MNQIAAAVTAYYADTLSKHGPTPRGVDWSCKPTQELRFVQLLRLCPLNTSFSLNDVGCGYGALRGYLYRRHRRARVDYLGVDLSTTMIDSARSTWGHLPRTLFNVTTAAVRLADYSIASGLFNVRLDYADSDWEPWVAHTLEELHATSKIGFAVNFMLPAQAEESSPQELYRPPTDRWISYCESSLDARVELIANYGMREHTLLVRRR